MTRPENLFEAASYDLNKFRERRMAERRSVPRDTADRRINGNNGQNGHNGSSVTQEQAPSPIQDGEGTGKSH